MREEHKFVLIYQVQTQTQPNPNPRLPVSRPNVRDNKRHIAVCIPIKAQNDGV